MNLQRCVVGIYEHWAPTSRVIHHTYRWMTPPAPADDAELGTRRRETPSQLRPAVRALMITKQASEMRLYEAALDQFKRQLRAVPALAGLVRGLQVDDVFDPSGPEYYGHLLPQ